MTAKEKLIFSMQQVESILDLIKGNECENYVNLKLTSVYYELQRQLDKLS